MAGLDLGILLFKQVAVIFLLILIGVFLRKRKMVSLEAARMFSNVAMLAVTPAITIMIFQRTFDRKTVPGIFFSLGAVLAFHIGGALVGRLLFRSHMGDNGVIDRLGCVYANCGFMGIPLIERAFGGEMLLYVAIYSAVFSIYQWSHGVMLVTGEKKIDWKKALTRTPIISAVLGMVLFFCGVRLPEIFADLLNYVGSMNTPLPSILAGVFVADVSIHSLLGNGRVYLASIARLVIMPVLFILFLWLIRAPHWFPGAQQVCLTLTVCGSCPAALSTMMMPASYGKDAAYAANLISVSTALSILTIPLLAVAAQYLFTF